MIAAALSLIFFILASTSLIEAKHVFVWKLTILATEFGHYFALGALFLLALKLIRPVKGFWTMLSITFLVLSLFLFGRPFVLAGPLVSFQSLWVSPLKTNVVPKRIQNFDFYPADSTAPAPWVMVVHTGGWDSGTPTEFQDFNAALTQNGFAVAALDYRLAPQFKWPAQKQDALACAAYIKNHAAKLNIDPNRWAIMGRSAGGQIAAAVAYQTSDDSLKGLIAFYTPADLKFAYDFSKDRDIINSRGLLVNYLGGTPEQIPQIYKDASPIHFVTKKSPPALLIHGRIDALTWVKQSRRLYEQIKIAGAQGTYIELPWATHAFDYSIKSPGGQVSLKATLHFLNSIFHGGTYG